MSESSGKSNKGRILAIMRVFVAVTAIGVVFFFCYRERDDLIVLFKDLPAVVFAGGVALFIFANIVISIRWYVLLRAQKIKVPFWAAVKVHFLGLFYNNIMVSSVGGDMLRVWYIAKHTDKRLEAGLSVLVDRVVGLFSLVLMALFFWLLFPVEGGFGEQSEVSDKLGLLAKLAAHKPLIAIIGLCVVGFFVFVLVFGPTQRLLKKALLAVFSHRQRVQAAITLYCSKPLTLLLSVFLTFIGQSLPIVGFYLMGRAMSIPAPAKYYFVFYPLSWVLGALPISIGGIGVLELGLAGLFMALPEVSKEQGIVLALCQRFVFILGSLPGIVIHVIGAHLPSNKDEFFVDSGKKAE